MMSIISFLLFFFSLGCSVCVTDTVGSGGAWTIISCWSGCVVGDSWVVVFSWICCTAGVVWTGTVGCVCCTAGSWWIS